MAKVAGPRDGYRDRGNGTALQSSFALRADNCRVVANWTGDSKDDGAEGYVVDVIRLWIVTRHGPSNLFEYHGGAGVLRVTYAFPEE